MSEEKKNTVYKFTLNTDKVVYLKEPKIADTEAAMKVAGMLADNNNPGLLNVLFQKELIKILVAKIDEKIPTISEKEALDNLFTLKEYGQVAAAVKQIAGDEGEQVTLTPEIMTL